MSCKPGLYYRYKWNKGFFISLVQHMIWLWIVSQLHKFDNMQITFWNTFTVLKDEKSYAYATIWMLVAVDDR